MRLELVTSKAVADYLAGSQGIIWPVGSNEQHGPIGLIGTDHLCAEAIARRMGQRQGVLVAPTLAVGQSHFHLGFPGTLALRPSTMMAVVGDHLASLETTGFRRLYILNGHGGNVAPIRSAVAEFYAARSMAGRHVPDRLEVRLRSWWELPTVDALRKRLYGANEGFHATPSEIAITQAAWPDHIGDISDTPAPPSHGRNDLMDHAGDNYAEAADYVRRFPDGRVISHSGLARREHGEALLQAAVDDLAADYTAFLAST
jgi:creatinine amidohydrolase